ncbi:MAG: ABC transporter substrate-binding protein [Myxococcales bacterium]|nr:ABC transporter substrate-binding protein [Myxococcales bacterium]
MKTRSSHERCAEGARRAGLALWLALALPACTAALDFSVECERDEACESLGPGLVCLEGRCERPDTADAAPPRDARVSPDQDARSTDLPGLLREGCEVVGADADDPAGVRLLGALLPAPGPPADAFRAGLALAATEINGAGGLGGRALGVLACGERDVDAVAERVRRMAEIITEPAVIGASTPALTAAAYTEAARPYGLVLLSPSGPEPARTQVGDDGQLWHARAGAAASAEAAGAFAASLGDAPIAVIHRGDAAGAQLASRVADRFCAGPCTAADLVRVPFSPYTPMAPVAAAARDAGAERVIVVGEPADVLPLLAALADAGLARTLLVEGPTDPTEVAAFLALEPDGTSRLPAWRLALRRDLLCQSSTLNASARGPAYADFAERLGDAELAALPEAALAHDAVFTLAYAIAAGGGGEVTGGRIAAGFARLQGGPVVAAGGDGWRRGVQLLADGNIDLEGASGGLRFDTLTGIAESRVELGWYDGVQPGVSPGGLVLDDVGRFTPPAPRPPCGEE